jgi:hypothetical protein
MKSLLMQIVLLALLILSSARISAASADMNLYSVIPGQTAAQNESVLVEINRDLIFSKKSPLRLSGQKPVSVKLHLPGLGERIATITEHNFINQQEQSYVGQIDSENGGRLFLTVANQTFFGLAALNDGRKYYITKKTDSAYAVKEKLKPRLPFRCETCEIGRQAPKRKIQKLSRPAGAEASPKQYSLLGGTVVVDVLAIYTEKARKVVGAMNREPDQHEHIKNLYQTYIEIANTALKDSGVDVKFNVVHKEQINFEELEDDDALVHAMDHLIDESDGIMDKIAGLKKLYKPDLVSLVVITQFGKSWDQLLQEGGITAGIGEMPIDLDSIVNSDSQYSALNLAYENNLYDEVDDYTLAHELGHNFGCAHDRVNEGGGKTIYDYAFGHRFKVTGPRGDQFFCNTIMAYLMEPSDERVGFFSNPDIKYRKVPTGVKGQSDSANNAKVIRQTAPYVASINGGEVAQNNKPPVIVETYPTDDSVVDPYITAYVVFYDPDGEIKSLSFDGSIIEKDRWTKQENGYWKFTEDWSPLNYSPLYEPNSDWYFDVVVVDNGGSVTSRRIEFRTKASAPVRITSTVLLGSGYIKITGKAPRDSVVAIETSIDLTQWQKIFSIPTPTGQFYINFDTSSKEKEYYRVRLDE